MENLTVAEAAAALSTTPTAILMLLRRGELIGQEVAGGWEVKQESLNALRGARKEDMPLVECRSSCAAKAGGCASCGSTAE
jgi:hypothetical protein